MPARRRRKLKAHTFEDLDKTLQALEEDSTQLAFIHIPKTGGTSIEAWAAQKRIDIMPHARPCNSTRLYQRGAQTRKHCVEQAALLGSQPEYTTFCVLRNPIARAVSSFNMRKGGANPGCRAYMLNQWVPQFLERGDADNHDRPQGEFASHCAVRLCFGSLQREFSSLLKGARVEDNALKIGTPVDPTRRKADPLDTVLPAYRPGATSLMTTAASSCTVSNVTDKTLLPLLAAYENDWRLYAATCSGDRAAAEDTEISHRVEDLLWLHKVSPGKHHFSKAHSLGGFASSWAPVQHARLAMGRNPNWAPLGA